MNFFNSKQRKMKIYIVKQTMRLNDKRAVSGIAVMLLLLLLSALRSADAYQVGETFRSCEICPEMVVLPAGEFTMGAPEGERGRYDDEGPQHQVTIPKSFAVGKYEVTVGQYAEFVRETRYKTANCYYPKDQSWDAPGFKQSNNHPVVCVSWDDAQAYVKWLSAETGQNYRLLSESEWEYAARAGTATAYHFGRTILGNMAQYDSDGTAAVGSFPANAFGLYDMHGNVWEWVEDCWHDDYTGAPTNGSAWLSSCRKGIEDDCEGYSGDPLRLCKELVVGKKLRVLRSGSWNYGLVNLRSAIRGRYSTTSRLYNYGFRVACDLTINP